MEVLKGGWIKQGSVIAFPHGWQRPAKTEEWVYETLIEKNANSIFIEFISFPWATLIDLIDRNKFETANFYLEALKNLPIKKSLIRTTACQHIRFNTIVNLLLEARITDLFASHKLIGIDQIQGVRLHPMSLYPVSFFDWQQTEFIHSNTKKYLYSFVGAYDENCYISDIREIIFRQKHSSRAIIKRRNSWHFDLNVYKNQIENKELSLEELEIIKSHADDYREILTNSVYSLCPSGAGPNSIRFWESIAFGVVPILLSDYLDIPDLPKSINYIRVPEINFHEFISNICSENKLLENSRLNDNEVTNFFLSNITNLFSDKASLIDLMKRSVCGNK